MNIAIVGATGNVGRKIIEVLENKNFPISELFLIASSKSEGKKINFKDKELTVIDLEKFDFSKVKIAFFAAGSAIAEKWAYKVAEKTIVIDNSKFFRKDPDIPLIVPEVNSKELIKVKNKNIIANANCSVIPLVVALKPLHDLYNIKRIIASTYQSVSGAGKAPMDELLSQTQDFFNNKKLESKYFTKQIAFNAIPHIDSFLENGYTKEEQKTADEVKKYIRFIGNRRLEQLGLNPIYDIKKNPLTWLDTMLNGVEHMNFFEGRATEYSKASTKGTWSEAFSGK